MDENIDNNHHPDDNPGPWSIDNPVVEDEAVKINGVEDVWTSGDTAL